MISQLGGVRRGQYDALQHYFALLIAQVDLAATIPLSDFDFDSLALL